jgi:prepilin-type N-terminal cleavage/methylation domain-containing protein/prepilin-type processing-associated H-X9-DG protein
MRRAEHGGFTLVELLVVMTIIGILVGLLMPAVQSVRESARRITCSNNLKQMGLACLTHENIQGFFPTGGWSWGWGGEPDRGFDKRQPGGWHYNILPYIEQKALHDLGPASDSNAMNDRRTAAQTPVAVFTCPTRHRLVAYPYQHGADYNNISDPTPIIGRSDYAACAGDGTINTGYSGPGSLSAGDGMSDASWDSSATGTYMSATGVIYRRSMVRVASIRHGVVCTYLIGERYIEPSDYYTGSECANDQGWDLGYDYDNARWTGSGGSVLNPPCARDTPGWIDNGCSQIFGSAHPAGFNMAFCDGSVHLMSYTIDPNIHRLLGIANDDFRGTSRSDTTPVDFRAIR